MYIFMFYLKLSCKVDSCCTRICHVHTRLATRFQVLTHSLRISRTHLRTYLLTCCFTVLPAYLLTRFLTCLLATHLTHEDDGQNNEHQRAPQMLLQFPVMFATACRCCRVLLGSWPPSAPARRRRPVATARPTTTTARRSMRAAGSC